MTTAAQSLRQGIPSCRRRRRRRRRRCRQRRFTACRFFFTRAMHDLSMSASPRLFRQATTSLQLASACIRSRCWRWLCACYTLRDQRLRWRHSNTAEMSRDDFVPCCLPACLLMSVLTAAARIKPSATKKNNPRQRNEISKKQLNISVQNFRRLFSIFVYIN